MDQCWRLSNTVSSLCAEAVVMDLTRNSRLLRVKLTTVKHPAFVVDAASCHIHSFANLQCLANVAGLKPEGDIAQSGAAKAQPAQEKPPVAAKPVAQMEHVEEAKRLLSERSSLLKTGCYSKESAVIQQLDAKIQELGNKALGTWSPAS